MSTFPTTVPDLEALIYDARGVNNEKWLEFLRELQALFAAVGAQPGVLSSRVTDLEAAIEIFGTIGFRNARAIVASDTTVTLTAEVLAVEGELVRNLNVTLNVTATGALGTAASRAINTTYYAWVGVNPTTGAATAILDDTYLRAGVDTSHGDLAGYTKWRRFPGAFRTNGTGSGNFVRAHVEGKRVVFAAYDNAMATGPDATVGSGSPSTVTPVNVPPVAHLVHLGCEPLLNDSAADANRLLVRRKGDTGNGVVLVLIPNVEFFVPANTGAQSTGTAHTHAIPNTTGGGVKNVVAWGTAWVAVNSSQQVEMWWSDTAGASSGDNLAQVYTLGYEDSLQEEALP